MNNVQVFDFKQNAIRATVDKDNYPLFVARDVALALGYSNPIDAMKRHCKNIVKGGSETLPLNYIYEPDLYRLIFGSNLDSAIAFQDWVFNEVLPTIRKTGGYSAVTTDQRLDRLEAELHALNNLKPAQPKALKAVYGVDYIKERIIDIVSRHGEKGVAESRISKDCTGFRMLSESEKQGIIMLLASMGLIAIKINDGKNGGKGGRKGKKFFIR